MTTTLYATYDGHVLRPDEPVPLPPNTRVQVTIEAATAEPAASGALERLLDHTRRLTRGRRLPGGFDRTALYEEREQRWTGRTR